MLEPVFFYFDWFFNCLFIVNDGIATGKRQYIMYLEMEAVGVFFFFFYVGLYLFFLRLLLIIFKGFLLMWTPSSLAISSVVFLDLFFLASLISRFWSVVNRWSFYSGLLFVTHRFAKFIGFLGLQIVLAQVKTNKQYD